VEVRADDEQRGVPADAVGRPQHRLAVARARPVHDQRRPGADDDADVRDEADVAIGDDVHVLRDFAIARSAISGSAGAACAATRAATVKRRSGIMPY
jgi:hypothetical protein